MYLKNAWFLAIFCDFWCIFVVFLVNQGDTDCPHVCIAHVSCFQSLLRSLYYLCLNPLTALLTEKPPGVLLAVHRASFSFKQLTCSWTQRRQWESYARHNSKVSFQNRHSDRLSVSHFLNLVRRVTWLPALRTWLSQVAKHSIFLRTVTNRGVFREFYVRFSMNARFVSPQSARVFSRYCTRAVLVCTRGHTHNSLNESNALIGQCLNSWRVTFRTHITCTRTI